MVLVLLVGPQASGRSTVARALGKELRRQGELAALVKLDPIAEMASQLFRAGTRRHASSRWSLAAPTSRKSSALSGQCWRARFALRPCLTPGNSRSTVADVDLRERVETLEVEVLAPVVRRALHDENCWPLTWRAESPSWTSLSPGTRGLFRLQGTARVGLDAEARWAVVLKVLGDVDFPGFHNSDETLYWRREAAALTSELFNEWDGPFVPVRSLGVQDTAEDEVWLWMECLDDADRKPRWSADQHAAAAYDLGAFGAQWSAAPPNINQFPWLAQRWLRGWLDYAGWFGAQQAAEHLDYWGHPVLAATLPFTAYDRFVALLDEAEDLLSVLEGLPVTLAHHDAQWRNLFRPDADPTRPLTKTVAVDWGFVGLAPVGADLGHLIGCNIGDWAVDPWRARDHDQATTEAYLRALRDYGWRGDERAVLFARAASAALQLVPTYAAGVSWLNGQPTAAGITEPLDWPQEIATKEALTVDAAVEGWAAGFTYLLDLGDEARQLAAVIRRA